MVQVQGEWWYIAADPHDFDTIYAAGNYESPTFKSTDGGQTWTQVLEQGCVGLAINPADGTAYCGRGPVQMSRDGGETWSRIETGLGPNSIVYSIALDPNDSSKVYVATPDGIFRLMGAPPEAAALTLMP